MKPNPRNILITIALAYANGEIHLGHLLEAIQADIWRRFQILQGNDCYFIGGADVHGTPIMLAAEKNKIAPDVMVKQVREDHIRDYGQFYVDFDHYDSTHSETNRELLLSIYDRLKQNGDIITKTITQFFDPEKKMFLADRFIMGDCPRCGAKEQYGDNCEQCGAAYHASELKNPRSVLTGITPIEKESEHYFFSLDRYADFLKQWTQSGALQPAIANKVKEWFAAGLQPWNISRDAPYFGFEMPDVNNKYFYVWLDAPIGYIAGFKNFCLSTNRQKLCDDFWKKTSDAELYHFIGKDIINFHALFWPALLQASDYRLPTGIFVHGFVTVNGEKMSKSRGTFITAKEYLKSYPTEYLRYYYATKLSNQVEDVDFHVSDFVARVNSDLVGKYVNLASRSAGFITKYFEGKLAANIHDEKLWQTFVEGGKLIAEQYEHLNFNRVVREIMLLADLANQYVDHHKPWNLIKTEDKKQETQFICTQALNLFRLLTLYLKPILPVTAKKVETFLNIAPLVWADREKPLLNHVIHPFQPMMQRIQSRSA